MLAGRTGHPRDGAQAVRPRCARRSRAVRTKRVVRRGIARSAVPRGRRAVHPEPERIHLVAAAPVGDRLRPCGAGDRSARPTPVCSTPRAARRDARCASGLEDLDRICGLRRGEWTARWDLLRPRSAGCALLAPERSRSSGSVRLAAGVVAAPAWRRIRSAHSSDPWGVPMRTVGADVPPLAAARCLARRRSAPAPSRSVSRSLGGHGERG